MCGLQGTYPRCKKCLPGDDEMQRLVLDAIVLVHNFRTEYVGYSQIKTVFNPEYVRVKKLEGYNRIAQYYFCPGEYDSEVDGSGSDSDDDVNSDIE
jgi:hypothetical protein